MRGILGGFKPGFGIETGWANFQDLELLPPQNIPGVLNLSVLHTRHALHTLYALSAVYSLIQGLASGAAGWISPSGFREVAVFEVCRRFDQSEGLGFSSSRADVAEPTQDCPLLSMQGLYNDQKALQLIPCHRWQARQSERFPKPLACTSKLHRSARQFHPQHLRDPRVCPWHFARCAPSSPAAPQC